MSIEVIKQILNKEKLSLEDLVVYVLARVYARVNWRRVARGRDSLDVFRHRVLVASYASNFNKFLERLCELLGVQSVRIESNVLNILEKESDKVLTMLRTESIVLVAKAYDLYKNLKSIKKKEGENE